MAHLGRFAEKLGLQRTLKQHMPDNRSDYGKYTMADAIMMLAMDDPLVPRK